MWARALIYRGGPAAVNRLEMPTPYTVATKATAIPCHHFVDVREVLHHLNQAEHRADDAHRGRVAARAFEHFGFGLRLMQFQVDVQLPTCGGSPANRFRPPPGSAPY